MWLVKHHFSFELYLFGNSNVATVTQTQLLSPILVINLMFSQSILSPILFVNKSHEIEMIFWASAAWRFCIYLCLFCKWHKQADHFIYFMWYQICQLGSQMKPLIFSCCQHHLLLSRAHIYTIQSTRFEIWSPWPHGAEHWLDAIRSEFKPSPERERETSER